MIPVQIFNPHGSAGLVLTCEHASCAIPVEYDDLGLDGEQLREHIGWDIGARDLTEALATHFDAPAVMAGVSRLLIDCNRDLSDHDLIVAESHGVSIPGNTRIDRDERQRRISDFYVPYHETVDAVVGQARAPLLLSIHSFTPSLNGRERRFDIGVLFDTYATEAEQLAQGLTSNGLRVRYNEPYSGLDGLIFSARQHGVKHQVRYLELEVNNRLLRSSSEIVTIAAAVAGAVEACIGRCASS